VKNPMRPVVLALVPGVCLALASTCMSAEPSLGQVTLASLSENSVATKLVGSWTLNRSLSQVPEPSAGGLRRGGPGGVGGGPPEGLGGSRGEHGGPPDRPEGPVGARTIRIEIHDADLRIISGNGHVRTVTPGGEAVERVRGPMLVTETARWEGDRLVIESVAEDGPMTSESIALAEDGSDRLFHTTVMPRPDSDELQKAIWVYDRAIASK